MITAQLVDAVSYHASYQSMARLDFQLSQLEGQADAALPRELQALQGQFTLVTQPTLGTRLRATLSRLPLVGWLIPSFGRSGHTPTPRQVDASLHAYLRSMDLVAAEEAPAPVHHLQSAPRVVREGKQGHGGGDAESGVVTVHVVKRSESH